jgi:hypothetical protein
MKKLKQQEAIRSTNKSIKEQETFISLTLSSNGRQLYVKLTKNKDRPNHFVTKNLTGSYLN